MPLQKLQLDVPTSPPATTAAILHNRRDTTAVNNGGLAGLERWVPLNADVI